MLLALLFPVSLAVLLRIVANPLANVFQKRLTQQSAEPIFIISATYGFLTLICLAFWPQLRFTGLSTAFWQSILLTGLLAMFGNLFLVKALHTGDLSVLGPVNAYKSVLGMIVGIFLLDEVPGLWGLLGILFIIGGSYIVLADKQHRTTLSWNLFGRPEVRLRLLALVFSAIDGVFLKKAILLSTPAIAFFYWCLLGFVFTILWIAGTRHTEWQSQARLLLNQKFTCVALLIAVGVTQMTSNVALAQMPVGYALALFQTSALVSVLFGYQFFGEQDLVRKLIGAAVMVAGAVLITLLG